MSGDRVVLCVQNQTVPGDPRVWREARDLADAGFDVTVLSPRGPGLARREVLGGVEVLRFPPGPEVGGVVGQLVETVAALAGCGWLLARLRLRGPISVLHAANPPDTFFLLALVLRPFGTRFVYDQHDACPELLEARGDGTGLMVRFFLLLERWSYRVADLVVAPNESYAELARHRGGKPDSQVVVVRTGPDEVGAVDGVDAAAPTVSFAGVMGAQDGVHVLIDAAALLVERWPHLRVELIGRGTHVPALQQRVERLGLEDHVAWLGWLQGQEYLEQLGRATVAVSPDEDNPFTRISTMIKVTDYLGAGRVAVVSDLPENRVTGGDAVVYFRPGDPVDLAAQIDALLAAPERRAELAARAVERAEQLRWCHSRDNLLGAYQRLLAPGVARAGHE